METPAEIIFEVTEAPEGGLAEQIGGDRVTLGNRIVGAHQHHLLV